IKGLELEYRYGDVTQPRTLPEMVKDIDYIIHNAGAVKVKMPEHFMKINCQGTKNILEAASQNKGLKKFIYISSLAAVGPSEIGQPLTEDILPHPISAYGRSKAAGEMEVKFLKDKINSVIIRPSAVYGPGDAEMFSFFQILNNRIRPYLGDWNRRLQLVHIDDLCYGVSRSLKAETESGAIYFIAESRSYSYREIIYHLRKAVGRIGLPIYIPGWGAKLIALISEMTMKAIGRTPMFTVEKAEEILANWEVSVGKAEKELGYKSNVPFPYGARETAYWYREEGWL
ncbi:MAG: NAD-dependent epimerase/dehydratase family protein, partial [candidate division Zixibacteria bacterium]|nr:NAD-dependent epimerase/dehydratase family protein [candidate division Zixibacteria bacterium]